MRRLGERQRENGMKCKECSKAEAVILCDLCFRKLKAMYPDRYLVSDDVKKLNLIVTGFKDEKGGR